MKLSQQQALWDQLQSERLVTGARPENTQFHTPWYIRTMMGIAGVIGAVFFLAFIALGFVFVIESTAASFIVGAGLCAGAAFSFKATHKSASSNVDFKDQFALVISLAGQGLLFFSFFRMFEDSFLMLAFLVLVLEFILFMVMAHFIHQVFSIMLASYSFVYIFFDIGLSFLVAPIFVFLICLVWLKEFSFPLFQERLHAFGYGLPLVAVNHLLNMDPHLFIEASYTTRISPITQWISTGLVAFLVIFTTHQLLMKQEINSRDKVGQLIWGVSVFFALLSLLEPGLGFSFILVLIAIAHANQILLGLGIISHLVFISNYYYFMEITLLQKSLLLMGSGFLLLLAYNLLKKWWVESDA